jgi:hypothetical protein
MLSLESRELVHFIVGEITQCDPGFVCVHAVVVVCRHRLYVALTSLMRRIAR